MHLIQRVFSVSKVEPVFLSKFKDCFGELGTLPGCHHIIIDPKVRPIINPPCKVPFAFKKKLKQELQRMTQLDIIAHVNEPTDWVLSLVAVENPNSTLWVCLDLQNLNKAIKRNTTTYQQQLTHFRKWQEHSTSPSWTPQMSYGKPKWVKKAPNSSPSTLPVAVSDSSAFHMRFTIPMRYVKPAWLRS